MIHMDSSKNIMTAQEQVKIIQRRERALFDMGKTLFDTDMIHINNTSIGKTTILELGLERNRIPKTPKIATQRGVTIWECSNL